MIKLSKRLAAIADMVPQGSRLVDVGCDHAYIDITLLQEGRIPHALAMDVADGPLAIARQNISLVGLDGQCEVRKSNGLSAYRKGEGDVLVIAGMGGILIQSILSDAPEKAESFRELILSPHREPWVLRSYLTANGMGICEERFIEDDGKFYPILRVIPGGESVHPDWDQCILRLLQMSDEELSQAHVRRETVLELLRDCAFRSSAEAVYGPCLIRSNDKILFNFVAQSLKAKLAVYNKLNEASERSTAADRRRMEMLSEIGMMQTLLFMHEFLL